MAAFTYDHTFRFPTEPARVFSALSRPGELKRWFAEHIEVEPRPGGSFRFWGRHTLFAPSQSEATQILTSFEPPSLLGFTWSWSACPTRVEFHITPAGPPGDEGRGASRLQVIQQFSRPLDQVRPEHFVDDFWRLTMGNLAGHLEGGQTVVLPDYTDPHPTVRATVSIVAGPKTVFAALTEPAILNRWIAADARVELKLGGSYRYGWSYEVEGKKVAGGPGRILKLVPDRLLAHDWPDWRGDPAMPGTEVFWELEPRGRETQVTLIHRGFARTVDRSDYQQGWMAFLKALKSEVEAGAASIERDG